MNSCPAIDVVVLTVDREQDIHACIDSVQAQRHPEVRLWVLDQGSRPEVARRLRERAAREGFCFVQTPRIGVAAGRNLGNRMGSAPIIVSLDNDATFDAPDTLERVAAAFVADPGLGALAFAITDSGGIEPDLSCWMYPPGCDFHTRFETARFCGAGHALRRAAFAKTPGYDPELRFFGEEIDLAWALVQAGFHIVYEPWVMVRHHRSPEHRVDWRHGRFYCNVRNMLYLLRKYRPGSGLLTAYIAGYLCKGLRNGLLPQTWQAVREGLSLPLPHSARPLAGKALAYVRTHEFAPRGNAWRRFRDEVLRTMGT